MNAQATFARNFKLTFSSKYSFIASISGTGQNKVWTGNIFQKVLTKMFE